MKSSRVSCCIFIITCAILILTFIESDGQVINDNIEQRLELKLNKPLLSNTTDCTLQWNCLNHALTKKLIQYHNDQWFFFRSADKDQLFINISGQKCRDMRGVQIMLIQGIACAPESYKILECVSLGDQDDVFLNLKNLYPNQVYLVLIDGYLNDFCSFEIELSDAPKGFPVKDVGLVEMEADSDSDPGVNISWTIPDSISNLVRRYDVFRKYLLEYKSQLVHSIPQGFNAKGTAKLDYIVEDILPDFGDYQYQIIGLGDKDRVLIAKKSMSYRRPPNYQEDSFDSIETDTSRIDINQSWLEIELDYPKACKLKVSIYDAATQSLLAHIPFSYNPAIGRFRTDITKYKEKGISYYRIEVVNVKTGEKASHLIMK